MTSLADLGEISKRSDEKRNRNLGYGALAGGGVATAGGLVGGGIPGTKPTTEGLELDFKRGAVNASGKPKTIKERVGTLRPKHAKGGILGFREQAHKKYIENAEGWHAGDVAAGRTTGSHSGAFWHSDKPGRIAVEGDVIPHLRRVKHGTHGLLGAGLVASGYGAHKVHQANQQKRLTKADSSDRRNAALVGGGLGVGATGIGIGAPLGAAANKYKKQEKKYRAETADIIPASKGKRWSEYGNDPKTWAGHTIEEAQRGGVKSGAAQQAKYLHHQYGMHAKPLIGVGLAGLGAAAYGANRMRRQNESR